MSDMICRYCGKKMVKHIVKEGARYHVTSWFRSENGAYSHCSEPDCENNHGPGHCVPSQKTDDFRCSDRVKNKLKKLFKNSM